VHEFQRRELIDWMRERAVGKTALSAACRMLLALRPSSDEWLYNEVRRRADVMREDGRRDDAADLEDRLLWVAESRTRKVMRLFRPDPSDWADLPGGGHMRRTHSDRSNYGGRE
jgi:hypothetical protein